jgi:hypothetical protein
VVYLDATDAGAFFRFTDVYARMTGGQKPYHRAEPELGRSRKSRGNTK